ncbi:hypothetical protein T484DRAFT_1839949 [Baffinella frigidus]|nr:hypothetical protein T484DRAFT_1839949 [Cryptophyta sp. CCMP2293]
MVLDSSVTSIEGVPVAGMVIDSSFTSIEGVARAPSPASGKGIRFEVPVAGMVIDSSFTSIEGVARAVTSKYLRMIPFLGGHLAPPSPPIHAPSEAGGEEGDGLHVHDHAVAMLREAVRARAHFDISEVRPEESAKRGACPALFAHAVSDDLVPLAHSHHLYHVYAHHAKRLVVFQV